jgi:outer membrane protein assembly factor BamB
MFNWARQATRVFRLPSQPILASLAQLPMSFVRNLSLSASLIVSTFASAVADDWPTYRHDASRSGFTEETLPDSLHLRWSFQMQHAPKPAWPRSKRMTFDRSPQTVIADGRIFFGSSVDGKLHALDAETGRPLWVFPTRAPIRFAPTHFDGRLYATSDDGYLYCLQASSGKLLWQKRGGPGDEMILGNARMVSRWPVRGGVVVHAGIVYFAAGIWPSDGVSLYALDPVTGKTLWLNDTAGSIYLGQPHGGAFANSGVAAQGYLAATDKQVFMPTGRGVPAAFDRHNGEFQYLHLQANTKVGGSAMTLSRHVFVNNGVVFDQATGKSQGKLGAGSVVATPDGLVCAFPDRLAGFTWDNEEQKARPGLIFKVRGLNQSFSLDQSASKETVVAADKIVSGGSDFIRLQRRKDGTNLWTAKVAGTVYGLAVADGRLYASTDQGTIYCFGPKKNAYVKINEPHQPAPTINPSEIVQAARDILQQSAITAGYALDLGCGDGRLAMELARQSDLFVYGIEPDADKVFQARARLEAAGLYGSRVMILQGDPSDTKLPIYFANLIVSSQSRKSPLSKPIRDEAHRLLRPYGGVFVHGETVFKRGKLAGAGQWTHQYADPANTVNSGDDLVKGPLGMLWFRDLEQQMTQRHGRGPAPLFKNGILFSEGVDGLIAVDAYNGRKLWEYHLPGILKSFDGDHLMGTSGTGSNYCISDDSVYVRLKDECLRIDARTGKLVARFKAPATKSGGETVWGHLAHENGLLFGSLSNPEHVVTYRFRPGGDMKDQLTESKTFFALDAQTGELKWRYDAKHSLRHNGISIGDGWVILIDRPLASFDLAKTGKPEDSEHPTGHLIALDAETGKEIWRNKADIFGTLSAISVQHGAVMMSYQATRFRLASEIGGRIAVFNLSDGGLLWQTKAKYESRPVLNDRTIYAQGGAWDLLTGDARPFNFKRSYGCGVLAGAKNMFVFRSATLGYFDLEKNEKTEDFGGIRPGCWINVIPAGGLVFSPDASAGCTCSYLNQSWIALQPDGIRAPSIEPAGGASPTPLEVRLTPDQPTGHSIHYTLDGSAPTKDSPSYSGPLRLASTAKLRARSFGRSSRPSNVTEAEFVIDPTLLELNEDRWTVIDAEGAKPESDWYIVNGTIKQISNVMVGGKRVMENTAEVERPGSLFLYSGRKTPRNGTISFEINSTDDDGVGFVFGYTGANRYHLWNMHSQRPFRALSLKDGDDYRVLSQNKRGFKRRQWYRVDFEFNDGALTVRIDGIKDLEAKLPAQLGGRFGFYSWGNSGVDFRNVRFDAKL